MELNLTISGNLPSILHSLTALEEGVIQFLAVTVLKELNHYIHYGDNPGDPEARRQQLSAPFKFEQLIVKPSALEGISLDEDVFCQIALRLHHNEKKGYLRVNFPKSMLEQMAQDERPILANWDESNDAGAQKRLAQFSHVSTVLWAEVGRVTLTPDDMNQLGRGDIILFDDTTVDFEGKKITGKTQIRIGDVDTGGLEATIENLEDVYRLKVENFFYDS